MNYSEVQCITVKNITVEHITVLYFTAEYSTVQFIKVQQSKVQYSAVQYSAVQYSTVQLSVALGCTGGIPSIAPSRPRTARVEFCIYQGLEHHQLGHSCEKDLATFLQMYIVGILKDVVFILYLISDTE